MASAAQVLANRLNAQKSTGPRTPEGKAVVSQNAVKHGLLAKEIVIKGEDPGEFEFYRDQMLEELAPVEQVEVVLADRVVSLSWWLQRAERLQTEAFDTLDEKETASPLTRLAQSMLRAKGAAQGNPGTGDSDLAFGRIIVKDFSNARVLDRLLMYQRRIEHSLYRTMGELQKQRLLRGSEYRLQAGQESTGPAWAGSTPPKGGTPNNRVNAEPQMAPRPHEGGTPNGAGDQEPSCGTKPICGGPKDGQVVCDAGVMSDLLEGEVKETNPMCDRIRLRREDAEEHMMSEDLMCCP